MTMTYNTLVAAKAAAGSVLNWVSYTKVDVVTVVNEAQSLIYSILRVREMRSEWVFGVSAGSARVALPARFLDPIGHLMDNLGSRYKHKIESAVKEGRTFEALSGTFGNNAFTTGAVGSSIVTAELTGHGLNQNSDITIAGSTDVDGVVINGTSAVTAIIDADHFQFEVLDAAATAGAITGGGAAASYTANNLISGYPSRWAIWDGCIQFDGAFDEARQFRMICYKSLPLLSVSNPSNFLTSRYPKLMRIACLAAAADYMRDNDEFTKQFSLLEKSIQSIAIEGDLEYRGADLDTETP